MLASDVPGSVVPEQPAGAGAGPGAEPQAGRRPRHDLATLRRLTHPHPPHHR